MYWQSKQKHTRVGKSYDQTKKPYLLKANMVFIIKVAMTSQTTI